MANNVLAAKLAQDAVDAYTLGAGRIGAIVAAVAALTGVVVAALALRRGEGFGTGNRRRSARAALVLGSIGMLLGAVVALTADGGLGTGNGLGGGVVAMLLGLAAAGLGWLVRSRERSVRAG